MTGQYANAAEYIDIMSRAAWEYLTPPLASALKAVDPAHGPVVELGAGTGLGTVAIAHAVPDVEIVAVEPSASLRAVLLARLVDDPLLARRVTVLDATVQEADLPERFGGLVAMNMIGHLDSAARHDLWALLARRLVPGAPAIVNLQPPDEPTAVPETDFAAIEVGHRVYEGSGRAEPRDERSVTWHMRYRTSERGVLLGERVVEYAWWTLSPPQLREEVAEQGLGLEVVGPAEMNMFTVVA